MQAGNEIGMISTFTKQISVDSQVLSHRCQKEMLLGAVNAMNSWKVKGREIERLLFQTYIGSVHTYQ